MRFARIRLDHSDTKLRKQDTLSISITIDWKLVLKRICVSGFHNVYLRKSVSRQEFMTLSEKLRNSEADIMLSNHGLTELQCAVVRSYLSTALRDLAPSCRSPTKVRFARNAPLPRPQGFWFPKGRWSRCAMPGCTMMNLHPRAGPKPKHMNTQQQSWQSRVVRNVFGNEKAGLHCL